MPGISWPLARLVTVGWLGLVCLAPAMSEDPLMAWRPVTKAYGVAADGKPLTSVQSPAFLDPSPNISRVLVIASPSLAPSYVDQADADGFAAGLRHRELAIWLVAAPDGIADATADALQQPIDAKAYAGKRVATQYLWRSIGLAAPDVVVVVKPGSENRLVLQPSAGSFADALRRSSVAGIGSIAAVEFIANPKISLLDVIDQLGDQTIPAVEKSAQVELLHRRERSAIDVATVLSKRYGNALDSVNYQQALALIGRLQLGDLTGEATALAAVQQIAEPYAAGAKSALGDKPNGGVFAGHLLFAELANRTQDPRYVALVRAAAEHAFTPDGQMRDAMPTHSEMSDAVFMGTPILVAAGNLTGEQRYFDMAIRHLRFMLELNLRDDGLHQHSPLDPAGTAWGRGNGFPALGLALSLSWFPENSPYRDEMLAAFRAHLAAMEKHQDTSGMWHQVVDRPESYPEFTVTCMTTMAIARGLRMGWLDPEIYVPVVQRAWPAIQSRIGSDAQLIDVCTGTGKQKSLRDYFDRTAIRGHDTRGGAMAMLVATEIALAQRDGKWKLD
ncbi:Unsaturated rhamnogalacturonyl hydrolase YteR [Rosistilla carotiformis]|uniref:Unsaturated rhamnogalacturonyl hydrolase YteR n=2 Tax=Rosistilla carotiformis TaxID=2528017 RepID=A0A518JTT7_9BACT|nr:Unsaturated rhamnogalacturonyl hydrolase YteR [Rosistilla carotiformis]